MSPPSIKNLLADLFCVEMATSLSLSRINLQYPSMEPLLVEAMSQEACFVYPYQTFAIKLLITFATIVNQMCGIHVFVMLTLVACRD